MKEKRGTGKGETGKEKDEKMKKRHLEIAAA